MTVTLAAGPTAAIALSAVLTIAGKSAVPPPIIGLYGTAACRNTVGCCNTVAGAVGHSGLSRPDGCHCTDLHDPPQLWPESTDRACLDMYTDMCTNMRVDMCVYMFVDTHT